MWYFIRHVSPEPWWRVFFACSCEKDLFWTYLVGTKFRVEWMKLPRYWTCARTVIKLVNYPLSWFPLSWHHWRWMLNLTVCGVNCIVVIADTTPFCIVEYLNNATLGCSPGINLNDDLPQEDDSMKFPSCMGTETTTGIVLCIVTEWECCDIIW